METFVDKFRELPIQPYPEAFSPNLVLAFGNAVSVPCRGKVVSKTGKESMYNAFLNLQPQVSQ